MKKKAGDIIAILFISGMIVFFIVGSIMYDNTKEEIIKNGSYVSTIIVDEFIGRQSVRSFTCKFEVDDETFTKEIDISKKYFENHQIGDTIIIKFLPEDPTKSIIMEDEEYKSCMGLPPKKDWKVLPKCKEDFHLVRLKAIPETTEAH